MAGDKDNEPTDEGANATPGGESTGGDTGETGADRGGDNEGGDSAADIAADIAMGALRSRKKVAEFFSPTVSLTAFVLGLLAGIPIAIFGLDALFRAAEPIFGFLMVAFVLFALVAALIVVFRATIWGRLFRFGQVELHRFASPLARAARDISEKRIGDAADDLREFAEMALARYSWVATRRWLVATATGFIAAIAALAASALLFQQNELLAFQNERLMEQTALLENQIELGEAARSLSIVPEILDIGAQIGEETAALTAKTGRSTFADFMLSPSLQSRIIAATNAARPYRYLTTVLSDQDENQIIFDAISRRPELVSEEVFNQARENIDLVRGSRTAAGELIERPVSPERGQIISLLFNNFVLATEYLTFNGADFSFSEVRQPNLPVMSFQHARLRYADFSTTSVTSCNFQAAYLEGARFRRSNVFGTDFSSLSDADVKPPRDPGTSGRETWFTNMAGADFNGATVKDSQFAQVNGVAMSFDVAIVHNVSFAGAEISASTFRHAIIGNADFTGAFLKGVDFDGALVFSESFLDDVEAAAVDETFPRDLFEIREAAPEELQTFPRSAEFWQLDGLDTSKVYVIRRIADFRVL